MKATINGEEFALGVFPDEMTLTAWRNFLHAWNPAISLEAWQAAIIRSVQRGTLPTGSHSDSAEQVATGNNVKDWLACRWKDEDLTLPYTPYTPRKPPKWRPPAVKTSIYRHGIR